MRGGRGSPSGRGTEKGMIYSAPHARLPGKLSRLARESRHCGIPPRIALLIQTPNASMPTQTEAELALATLLVEALNLEDIEPASIDPQQALFGSGLGLDSIDALEMALAISKAYGFQLRSDNDDNRRIFASLAALSAHVESQRTT